MSSTKQKKYATTRRRVAQEAGNLLAEKTEQLRGLIPEAFTEGKVDWEKLRSALGELVDDRPERYSFTWAGKRDAIRLLQTPSRATLVPDKDESVNFDTTQHLFIEGDNLEVLKLLYKPYFGRVKMMYFDPPYNRGEDLVYRDDYADPLESYLKFSGQKTADGNLLTSNPETSGRYHSAWLSMMYPRLFLARQLLREDGIAFVSIDDHEVHNLRLMMNEIFGEENFIGSVIWNSTKSVTNTALISVSHTYNLVFARSKEYFVRNRHHFRLPEPGDGFDNPDNDPRGPWKADPFQVGGERPNQRYEIKNPKTGKVYRPNRGSSWKNELKVFEQLLTDNRIVFGVSGEAGPQRKRFQHEAEERGRVAKTIWDDVDTTTNATRYLDELFGAHIFDNPKPVDLLKRFIELGVHDPREAIVLDFFAGSATAADAVLEQNREDGGNRRFIMVQLPEPTTNRKLSTIAEIGKERIRRVIKNMAKEKSGELDLKTRTTPEDLGFKVFKLASSNYRQWEGVETKDAAEYSATLKLHADPLVSGWKVEDVIYEVAIKEGYGLNCRVEKVKEAKENAVRRVTDPDKAQSFLICLDETIHLKGLKPLALKKDDLFICRDCALDDATAANLALQCRLKTI